MPLVGRQGDGAHGWWSWLTEIWGNTHDKKNSLTAKEYSELSGTPRNESETILNELSEKEH
jgi:hypothetical protein